MATKRCGRCDVDQPLHEFHRAEEGYQPWCKSCKREYAAAHYRANHARRRADNRRRHAEFLKWYTRLKAKRPCSDCGNVFHPAAMQWDHLPGRAKTADVSVLARRGSRKRVLDEIANCELVCANCHAVRSYFRRGSSLRRGGHTGAETTRTLLENAPVAQPDRARDF